MRWVAFVIGTLLIWRAAVLAEEADWELDDTQFPTLRVLDDSSFEHDTQAATGQTTGSWLVLFMTSDCDFCDNVEAILLQLLSQSQGRPPILAKVNTVESPRTGKRFKVAKVPSLKLFRNRRMFSYQGQWSAEGIVAFIKDDWRDEPSEIVPEELSSLTEIKEQFLNLALIITQYLGNRPGLLGCVGAMIATGGYLVTKKWLTSKQNRKRPRQQPKKRSE